MTGKGSKKKPFKLTTVSKVGTTGLRVVQVDSYRVTKDYYRTDVTIKNRGSSAVKAILYRGGDCYLNLADGSTKGKLVQSNQPACVSTNPAAPEELRLRPLSSGSKYYAGDYNILWDRLGTQQPFENTLDESEVDAGLGLSWNVKVRADDKVVRSTLTKVTIPAN